MSALKFAPGTLGERLQRAVAGRAPVAAAEGLGRRARIERVRAAPAGAGTTRLQESSLRAGVLAAVRELGGKGRRAVSVEELAERVGLSAAVVRGHLHKLLEGGHIVCA